MPQSARHQDSNGYLLVKGCPISTSGIFQYSAAQVGLPGDPKRIVNVFRPESAVSDPEYIGSLDIIPLINDHEMLSGFQDDDTATAPEEKGVDGVLMGVLFAKPWARGDIKIFSRSMQADLNAGKRDLSLGYTCDFIVESGSFDGQEYEVIQTNMRGNHIALVEVGRVPGAQVLDGKKLCFDSLSFSSFSTLGGAIMSKPRRALDSDVVQQLQAQLKALLPTFEQFLSEEAAEPAHQGGEGGEGAEAGTSGAAASATGAENQAGVEGAENQAASADPEAGAEAGADPAADPAESGSEEDGSGELMDALKQIQDVCSKLIAKLGSNGADEGNMNGGVNGAEGAARDTVEGLEGEAREGAADEGASLGEGGQGEAPQGPAAGKHEGADAALRSFYADVARKDRLYNRLSRVVGTFDGAVDVASATFADIASYGVKKLGIKCAKGTEGIALDAYLTGVEKATAKVSSTVNQTKAADAAAQSVPAIEAYFKE